jgi:hypothetical protein
MTESVVQIITAFANQAYAVALSTPEGDVPQSNFEALATTDPSGHSESPTHCWTNGWIRDDIIALFEADTTKFTVTRFPNRQAFNALAAYSPQLYPYLGT